VIPALAGKFGTPAPDGQMENVDSLYGLTKGSTLKVDVVGENTKRRRLIVVALFIAKLVKTDSVEKLISFLDEEDKAMVFRLIDTLSQKRSSKILLQPCSKIQKPLKALCILFQFLLFSNR
jgi:hypothetical protein